MRKSTPRVYALIGCILLCTPFTYSQSDCVSSLTVYFENESSPCQTSFDLCFDRYSLNSNQQFIVMNVALNDLAAADIMLCDSELVPDAIYPRYGDVRPVGDFPELAGSNIDPCLFAYKANQEKGALLDTFYYALMIRDVCTGGVNYCDASDPNAINGRIWTIDSKYTGSKEVDSYSVSFKAGPDVESFYSSNSNLSYGDMFFVDGTGNRKNTDWIYTFNFVGGGSESISVHVSCSEQIFGQEQGNGDARFIPISGCVLTPQGGKNAIGPSGNCDANIVSRNTITTRETVTTELMDTTLVIIERQTILPLELLEFTAIGENDFNIITWTVGSAKDEFNMTLQKSNDGVNFENVKAFANIVLDTYTFYDREIKHRDHYYRIMSTSLEGQISFSEIRHVRREVDSSIEINPNPTFGRLNLNVFSNNDDALASVFIYDLSGRLISQKYLGGLSTTINVKDEGLSSGIYFIEVSSVNGLSKIEKLIIQ